MKPSKLDPVVKKPKFKGPAPLNIPFNKVDETHAVLEQDWANLENAAIVLCQDIGFLSFGGEKARQLKSAVQQLRQHRAEYAKAVLEHIQASHDHGDAAMKFIGAVEEMCKGMLGND